MALRGQVAAFLLQGFMLPIEARPLGMNLAFDGGLGSEQFLAGLGVGRDQLTGGFGELLVLLGDDLVLFGLAVAGPRQQLRKWACEVNDVLHRSSGGRMISEWAKRPECWEAVRSASYSPIGDGIPEIQ